MIDGLDAGKQAVTRLHQLWSTGDLALLPAIYAPDFTAHWPPSAAVPVRRGHDAVGRGLAGLRAAFPDWREVVLDLFGEGDRVASRYVASGTHLGAWNGLAPSGCSVEIHEISVFRIRDGLIVEQWCMFDELARLQQLAVDAEYLRRMLKL
jgi:steroid delta-isomerase-like uncharacterized protein